MTSDTPLDRAANVLRLELQDYIPGFDNDDWDRFSHKLASDVLGAAQLPERLDVATEMRTANLIALSALMFTGRQSDVAGACVGDAMLRLGLLTHPDDKQEEPTQ